MAVLPAFQSSYGFESFRGKVGTFADSTTHEGSNKIARGLLRAGRMAFKVPTVGGAGSRNSIDPGEVFQIVTAGTAASVSAIGTAMSSSTGTKTVGSGITAGAVGSGLLQPARALTVVFDSSTDWDPTNGTITYVNHLGQTVTETLAIATSTTATTTGLAQQFVSFAIPAQTGSGGTATVGIAALASGALTAADFFGIVLEQNTQPVVSTGNLYGYPGISSSATEAHYVDGNSVPCINTGCMWVDCEEAIADRDPVYVRIASGAGGSNLGAFRNDADSGSCILVSGARFVRDSTAAGAAMCRFYHL